MGGQGKGTRGSGRREDKGAGHTRLLSGTGHRGDPRKQKCVLTVECSFLHKSWVLSGFVFAPPHDLQHTSLMVLPDHHKEGNVFQVRTFLGFVSSSAPTPYGAYEQTSGRNRIDPHRAKIERLKSRTLRARLARLDKFGVKHLLNVRGARAAVAQHGVDELLATLDVVYNRVFAGGQVFFFGCACVFSSLA